MSDVKVEESDFKYSRVVDNVYRKVKVKGSEMKISETTVVQLE